MTARRVRGHRCMGGWGLGGLGGHPRARAGSSLLGVNGGMELEPRLRCGGKKAVAGKMAACACVVSAAWYVRLQR